jgi:hypothetical protein
MALVPASSLFFGQLAQLKKSRAVTVMVWLNHHASTAFTWNAKSPTFVPEWIV